MTTILIFLLSFCAWLSHDSGHQVLPFAFLGLAVGAAVIGALERRRSGVEG